MAFANGFKVKETPYGRAVAIQDMEGQHRAIGLHLVRNKKHLTGAEVRFLRKGLDMSQVTLAKCLEVGETTVRNWESGRIKHVASARGRALRAGRKMGDYICLGDTVEKALTSGHGHIRQALQAPPRAGSPPRLKRPGIFSANESA